MVSLALKDMVGCPSCKQGSANTGYLEGSYGPSGLRNVQTAALGKEFWAPVEDAHAHNIYKKVGHTKGPNPTVSPNHYALKLLACCLVLRFLIASERSTGQVGQANLLRFVAQAHENEDGTAQCDACRNPETPLPCTHVCGIVQGLYRRIAYVIVGQILGNMSHNVAVCAHIGAQSTHDCAAHNDGKGRAYRV